jgi:hypothetical protein
MGQTSGARGAGDRAGHLAGHVGPLWAEGEKGQIGPLGVCAYMLGIARPLAGWFNMLLRGRPVHQGGGD